MSVELTTEQREARARFRRFVEADVAPAAARSDADERIPDSLVRRLAAQGYLAATVPTEHGGSGMDAVTFGLLNEELGRACSSTRTLLTVHSMVCRALARWGRLDQRLHWLPRLAAGDMVAAFCLTEPGAGSDASAVETTAERIGDRYRLAGHKRWISFGQIASLFLVFARCEGRPVALLVERGTPGLTVTPIRGVLGTRASMLAEIDLDGCEVAAENLVGGVGFGIDAVAAAALDLGRYSVAWGCVGIAQACLDACLTYAGERATFGSLIRDHQLVQRMITDIAVGTRAARLLCLAAGARRERQDPQAVVDTMVAKYFAAGAAVRAATDAVQIHGANGCHADSPIQRLFRDAKIMEIIEGSTQLSQVAIATYLFGLGSSNGDDA
jgi:glutaryl-CoA dehydrogenase (non-decarboxylating)